ncbi:PQQ-dependent sugar dehydrogenase [Pandoraea apista]|uniref:Sorbosone dehydrogenase family protein n=1 Tax=Pandoraea apista TaxID=93218 RepID=A0ABX9ZUC5_9BURK|nr:PQQ-dependent sugar dehydrogenase [Pandoraea apista]PTE02807.1 sorbosone dehydrogenase [Pandoraea apista]RRJ29082.1 sorbosone dehydrogenase family protein [Pandoraea apista]RRJ81133.1 sorbosone dehydrogenase family protein [Pandoraea apista]RSD18732.1 sorbosone dehydrogenase family protein [Pandoraea apista]RSK83738.1 sorbosone dehydrogenase family protein [Pandoraea apista]
MRRFPDGWQPPFRPHRPTRISARVGRLVRFVGQAGLLIATAITLAPRFANARDALPIERLTLPPGFYVEVLSDQVPGARGMVLGPKGTLFVGSRAQGDVYAITLDPSRAYAAKVRTVASGLNMPVGVAMRNGALYISAVSRIVKLDDIENRLDNPGKPAVVYDKLPSESHHGWRYIAFGPDQRLYIGVGAPCNVCKRDENRYAIIGSMKPDGTDWRVVARGVRNTVGFDWQPGTRTLWFTDNGRDLLGDDVPDDKLNRLSRPGENFGFPYCHAGDVADPEFGQEKRCSAFTPPVAKLGAHVAALGMKFYTGKQFPEDYRGSIFIAEHGSWNRSRKVGYRVVRVVLDAKGNVARQEVFAQGWLGDDESVWGRPVDLLTLPDGSLLISDDYAGAIYRITYRKP